MRCVQCAHELSCNAPRRGKGDEVQEAVEAENKKDHAGQISGDYGSGFHNLVLLSIWRHYMTSIILMSIELMGYASERFSFFYDARLSRDGPRLASDDEGDARPDEVCSRWH